METTMTTATLPTRTATAAPRPDMYAPIHKALRSIMADTLLRVGRLDVSDAGEMAATLGQVEALLDVCTSHLAHENAFVHPAIEARQPGTAGRIAAEHEDHLQAIAALREDTRQLRASATPSLATRLYRHLALFVAENLQHMHYEETVHNEALWTHYSDADLKEIHDRLLASIAPPEMMQVLRWMVPALAPMERAGLMGELKAALPPEAFQAPAAHRAPAPRRIRLDEAREGAGLRARRLRRRARIRKPRSRVSPGPSRRKHP
jgi:hypothetical protein